jgi:RNA polymerase sigma-70 factor, ECF subfamily
MPSTSSHHLEEEFLQAYDAYSDAIFRHCYYRLFDRERAKDVMQDTFVRTWEYLQKGEKVDNIRALLYRIANNLIIDFVRKKKETSLDAMQEEGFDPATDDDMSRTAERLDGAQAIEALQQLDDVHREVLVLRYVNGLQPAEIAEITGETANTVSVRIHRGLGKLRVLLA